jgi:hypothetical protein
MLTIVGTIKIDDGNRREHFENNLRSLEPIAHLLEWRLNVAGRYGDSAQNAVEGRWPGSVVTTDDESPAYWIMRAQLDALPDDAVCWYWLEDHWFTCQHVSAFLELLEEFERSEAEVLTVSHLHSSWEQKAWLPVLSHSELHEVKRVDRENQERVWAHCPGAYAAGIPMICKKRFALDMLEHCRGDLEGSKKPAGFELPPHKAKPFLERRSWNEIIPTFHVCREVFRGTNNPRAMLWDEALKILEERGN